jgi:hypothetical protein
MSAARAPQRASFIVRTIQGVARVFPFNAFAPRPLHFVRTTDPQKVSDYLFQLQTKLNEVLQTLRSNPFSVCSVVTNQTFAGDGASVQVYHRLGRIPNGWLVVDAQHESWAGWRIPPVVGAVGPDQGPQEATYLTLANNNQGTYAFLFF